MSFISLKNAFHDQNSDFFSKLGKGDVELEVKGNFWHDNLFITLTIE